MSMTAHIASPQPLSSPFGDSPSHEQNDYFSAKLSSPLRENPPHHPKLASISSINSVCSDLTLNGSRLSHESFASTETLVNDPSDKKTKNVHNLKLRFPPGHRRNPSHNQDSHKRTAFTPISAREPCFNGRTNSSSAIDVNSIDLTKPIANLTFQPPILKKSSTASSLPIASPVFPFPKTLRNQDYLLPSEVQVLNCDQAAAYINNITKDIDNNLPNFLVIDVRPFTEHIKSHIAGSLNFSLPSTLLRRSNFDLQKCINSLTQQERLIFENYLNKNTQLSESGIEFQELKNDGIPCGINGLPALLLYDNFSDGSSSNSLGISCIANKFVSNNSWNAPVYVLQGGFNRFNEVFPSLVETGTTESLNSEPNLNLIESPKETPDVKDFNFSSSKRQIHGRSASLSAVPLSSTSTKLKRVNSPVLSRFVLPERKAIFKTRLNEEILTNPTDSTLQLATGLEKLNEFEVDHLPEWARHVLEDESVNALSTKFNNLELKEKKRLNAALSVDRAFKFPATLEEEGENLSDPEVPSISSGVELGAKNRYKDIFPYDHSRVKLNTNCPLSEQSTCSSECNYINASYLSVPGSDQKYIATQGPLSNTIGDFWRIVINHRSPIVFSLTAQNEGGVEKCAPFWLPGTYSSGDKTIQVELMELKSEVDSMATSSGIVVRRLKIKMENIIEHEVLQLHIQTWPDLGTFVEPRDILSVIFMKRYIMSTNQSKAPVIVHCSAGCGRTGTFCAIDSVVDILIDNQLGVKQAIDYDPILNTVDAFRKQRVSMVQTLRQYLFIYDCVMEFIRTKINNETKYDNYREFGIVQNFVEDSNANDSHVLKRGSV